MTNKPKTYFRKSYTKKEICFFLEITLPTLNSWLRDFCEITVYSGKGFTPKQVDCIYRELLPDFLYDDWKEKMLA